MARPLEYGEQVLLWEVRRGRTFSFVLREGDAFHSHKGSVPHGEIVGRPEGSRVRSSTGTEFVVFRPRLPERMMKVRRRTQIVYPKDAGWLALALDLAPGMRVVEIGTGSGAFTILLAQLVGHDGRVYTFDRRQDFLDNALENVARAGLLDRVEARVLEAGKPFPVEGKVDAVFLDIPEPWLAVPPAYAVLAPGRPLAGIVPTAEQLKGFVTALERGRFVAVEAVELLERRILVREKEGVRPFERMVGFTGYLISARKALPAGKEEECGG
jgi:tRNA (adenine57-N1/adenine58-N1)-methyltransferase